MDEVVDEVGGGIPEGCALKGSSASYLPKWTIIEL